MSDTSLPASHAPQRTPTTYALCDLAVAPENMRFAEPPDDELPQLAATIRAAGLLQPLTVRPGRRKEKPAMVLDGRRRLLALQLLLEAGEIAADFPVSAFEETDPARQAAAVLLTNTAVPVHVADVIASIGKMLRAKLTPAVIAAALGYAELEVRRLAALSALHPKALEALKAGRLSLRQARLLARLPSQTEQGEIAKAVLDGFGFQEWRVTERLDAGQVTTSDRRFALVGPARYAAAGGRVDSDLFGERADVLLDPDVLQAQWTDRARAIVQALAAERREVRILAESAPLEDDQLEAFGHAYGFGLDAEGLAAWRAAQAVARDAEAALDGLDLSEAANDEAVAAVLSAKVAADQASEPGRPITLLQVFADGRTGLDVRAYGPVATTTPDDEVTDVEDDAIEADGGPASPPAGRPMVEAPAPDVAGVGHALHAVRTDAATRALIRALADDPAAALVALTARLFDVLVRRTGIGRGDGALSVAAEAYGRPQQAVIASLDGEVRRRLADRRGAWEASGRSTIAWVAGLEDADRLATLAELVALSLDLREERTTSVRRRARAEAVEIAAMCGADVSRWWTPDEAFLRAHSKPQLLTMLTEMGVADPGAAGRKKDELVTLVAERAAERRWAPVWLSWAAEPSLEGEPEGGEARLGDSEAQDVAA